MQQPRTFAGGREFMVSSKEFPIQTTLTAVRMDLQPGALRELHWHPHADEWQFYVRGKARVGVFGSHGRTRVEEFGPNDVGFVQQGYGHYIEHIGDEPTEIISTSVLFLNNYLPLYPSTRTGLPKARSYQRDTSWRYIDPRCCCRSIPIPDCSGNSRRRNAG